MGRGVWREGLDEYSSGTLSKETSSRPLECSVKQASIHAGDSPCSPTAVPSVLSVLEAWPYPGKALSCHTAKAQFKLASGWSPWVTELIIFVGCNNQVKYSLPWLSYCLTSQPHLHPVTSSTLLLTPPSLYLFKMNSITGRGYKVPTGGMEKPVWGKNKTHKLGSALQL